MTSIAAGDFGDVADQFVEVRETARFPRTVLLEFINEVEGGVETRDRRHGKQHHLLSKSELVVGPPICRSFPIYSAAGSL